MRIDIWSDVICPYCWIGKRHLETALQAFRGRNPDVDVEIVWRAYELDPAAPRHQDGSTPESSAQMLSRKYGMSIAEAEAGQEQMAARFRELGLRYDWRAARITSTFDAHRLAALAARHGKADEVDEALRTAHFADGLSVADPGVLLRIGVDAGVPAEEVRQLLAGDDHAAAVHEDVETARAIGVKGVPFFVFDGRLAVSGAQPVEVFEQALARARVEGEGDS